MALKRKTLTRGIVQEPPSLQFQNQLPIDQTATFNCKDRLVNAPNSRLQPRTPFHAFSTKLAPVSISNPHPLFLLLSLSLTHTESNTLTLTPVDHSVGSLLLNSLFMQWKYQSPLSCFPCHWIVVQPMITSCAELEIDSHKIDFYYVMVNYLIYAVLQIL
ncbi:unnamed protein product, partial [Vitis vinifera]